MKVRFVHQAMLAILLLCKLSVCLATDTPDVNDSSKYLESVREFADNVLKYGKDTYGPKHTPLFVDGLNIHNHEPVKWISPEGEKWILSNLASQQTLLRTLDGLSANPRRMALSSSSSSQPNVTTLQPSEQKIRSDQKV